MAWVQWQPSSPYANAHSQESLQARIALKQRISEEQYQQFVLTQPDAPWELHDGRLVEKPGITFRVDAKVPVYQQRGDLEMWCIHPYERTLTSWQRQPDGSYQETIHRDGTIAPVALPGVTIELETLFDD